MVTDENRNDYVVYNGKNVFLDEDWLIFETCSVSQISKIYLHDNHISEIKNFE